VLTRRSSPREQQLVVVIIAFWGTFAEGSFVATCLLYELQFAHDRKVIKRNRKSSAVGRLVSLAMRTSGCVPCLAVACGMKGHD